jgi:hypothetical protein
MPTWAKVLIALVVLFALFIAGIAGAGYYFVRKIADEPGGPLAAMVRLTNPDYEVLEVNEKEETITVKHKKTGKTGTIRLEQLRNGAINPKDLGMTHEEAGIVKPPGWMQFPGSTVESTAGDARTAQMTLTTTEPREKVTEYYESQLKANGYDVTSVSLTRTIVGSSKEGKGTVTVQMLPAKEENLTRVLVALKQDQSAPASQ